MTQMVDVIDDLNAAIEAGRARGWLIAPYLLDAGLIEIRAIGTKWPVGKTTIKPSARRLQQLKHRRRRRAARRDA